jgi:hypothetical protein
MQRGDHSVDLGIGHVGEQRKRKNLGKCRFGHGAIARSSGKAVAIERVEMHGPIVHIGRDLCFAKGREDRVTSNAEDVAIDANHVQVMCMADAGLRA